MSCWKSGATGASHNAAVLRRFLVVAFLAVQPIPNSAYAENNAQPVKPVAHWFEQIFERPLHGISEWVYNALQIHSVKNSGAKVSKPSSLRIDRLQFCDSAGVNNDPEAIFIQPAVFVGFCTGGARCGFCACSPKGRG